MEREQRLSRIDESRRLEEREFEIRSQDVMKARDPLHVPPEIIPGGWTYMWLRQSLMNEPDVGRDTQTRRLGFTPVPGDRHPELYFGYNHEDGTRNSIVYNGLMLCEIPTKIQKERDDMAAQANRVAVTSMPALHGMEADPTMPQRTFVNEVQSTFGMQSGASHW